jgi:adenylate cyclase
MQQSSNDTASIHSWLVSAGLSSTPMAGILDQLCRRLNDAGLSISRGFASIETLHPLLRAHSVTWERGAIAESEFQHGDLRRASWHESPFRHMINNLVPRMERELTGPQAQLDYPVLKEFQEAGHTAWIAFLLGVEQAGDTTASYDLGVICSWTTDRPGGWTAAERDILEEISRTMALAMRSCIGFRVTRDLLATYLGRDASDRVTAGDVQRGVVGEIDACLLYADLRGFTDYAEATPPATVAERLNAYLDCMGAPVEAQGGQILKFLGDGLLAVFMPSGLESAAVCAAALDAAEDILQRVSTLNADAGADPARTLRADVALHKGQVLYGNVGTAQRLDFTVIGPAVNEAARLEGLCRDLGTNLLISHSFYAAAGPAQARMKSLGHHRLRGVREEREVFTCR